MGVSSHKYFWIPTTLFLLLLPILAIKQLRSPESENSAHVLTIDHDEYNILYLCCDIQSGTSTLILPSSMPRPPHCKGVVYGNLANSMDDVSFKCGCSRSMVDSGVCPHCLFDLNCNFDVRNCESVCDVVQSSRHRWKYK